MAKENYAFITGIVSKAPVFIADREGNIKEAVLFVRTIRRGPIDTSGNFDPKYDDPTLRTKDPRLIDKITTLGVNDVIESKCAVVTNYAGRTMTCPYCGHRFVRSSFLTFLAPISLSLRNHCETDTEAMHILNDFDVAELSNSVKLIGRLTSPDGPRYHESEATGKQSCAYQIAVNRKYLLYGASRFFNQKSDGNETEYDRFINENRSDYPWVISYDRMAKENSEYLHQNSLIYIDGYFHTRPYVKTITCESPDCGKDFDVNGASLTITPYDMEYLEDCDIPDIKNDDKDHIPDITDDEADMG